ncbi:MAG: DUF4349 domain-containing protein [Myxococcales bacterium]|nr:DUF4349 domain-containing protein [Myxococcales bacterium]
MAGVDAVVAKSRGQRSSPIRKSGWDGRLDPGTAGSRSATIGCRAEARCHDGRRGASQIPRDLLCHYVARSATTEAESAGGAAPAPGDFAALETEASDSLYDELASKAPSQAAAYAPFGPASPHAAAAAKHRADAPKPALDPLTQIDGESGPLLVYEAWLRLAVYEVGERQRQVIEATEAVGGFLRQQNATQIVVRVPAARFKDALSAIEAIGEVQSRRVQTQDVTEEFRDVQTRLDSARKVRERLLALLERAVNVEESLKIERELERLLKEIERMEGRLKFLGDRIALSTLTVDFSAKAEEVPADEVTLPFPWLDSLGLRNLTELER